MRRINESRKQIKFNTDSFLETTSVKNLFINLDLFYILKDYDRRIKIKKKIFQKNSKKSQIFTLFFDGKINQNLDYSDFVNLNTVIIKNLNYVNMEIFENIKLKCIKIENIEKFEIKKIFDFEEIYLKNIDINFESFKFLLKTKNLTSLHLVNVQIFIDSKKKLPMQNLDIQSDSEEFVNCFECISDHEEVINIYALDFFDFEVTKLFDHLNIKKLSLLNTNIKFESIFNSIVFKKLINLKYLKNTRFFFINYGIGPFTYFKGNFFNNIDLNSIEFLSIHSLDIFKYINLTQNVKSFKLNNYKIDDHLINILISKCRNCVEFSFINCIFSNLSFYKFINFFGIKIKYLNLIDSTLPLDSLDILKKYSHICKIVFRDKRVLK